jgi:tetratricopeptide (TPR) repeat protein
MKLKSLFAIIVLSCIAFQARSQSDNQDYAKAMQYYYLGQYQIAATAFTDALKKEPAMYNAYLYRGNCYVFLHNYADAKKDYDQASKGLGNNADLLFGYGYLNIEMGSYKKALSYLNKALAIKSNFALAYNSRGVIYQHLGNPRLALENYTAAINADSTLALAYNNRGTAVYENQDIAGATNYDIRTAIKDFDKAIALDPSLCVARRNRGLAYSLIKKYDLALADLNAAVKCDPSNVTYYLNRGKVLTDIGDYTNAVNDFSHVLDLTPKQAEAYLLMGEAREKSGNLQQAVIDEMNAALIDKRYKAISDYNIARFYADNKEKELMMKYLALAKKEGYFKPTQNLADFLKASEFIGYKNDPDFLKFRNSVRKNRM